MLKKREFQVYSTVVFFFAAIIFTAAYAFARDQVNLLTKAEFGDWAAYSVTRENKTIPLLGFKDQKHWKTVSMADESSVRIDEYFEMGGRRTTGLGRLFPLSKPFEPISGLAETTVVTVVSESAETLTLAGKSYACTKIQRKINQPVNDEKFQGKWVGTSTIWICPDVPLGGLVKMENSYEDQLNSSADVNKIVETWVLTDFGFKNWKE
jgi:hypothetical protein